jgi:hypothetical protein
VPPLSTLPPARGLTLVPAAQGLDVEPTGREISFGRHRAGAVASARRVLGHPPDRVGPPPGCPLVAATWSRDGLTMFFEAHDDAFVGWRAGGGRTFDGEMRRAGRSC